MASATLQQPMADAQGPVAEFSESDFLSAPGSLGEAEKPLLRAPTFPARKQSRLMGPDDEWTSEEAADKGRYLPALSESGALLATQPEVFGQLFYDDLLRESGAFAELFAQSSMDRVSVAFGRIPAELLRLMELPSKAHLLSEMHRLALRHIDYSARRHHIPHFGECMIMSLERFVLRQDGVWNERVEHGWRWIFGIVVEMLFDLIDQLRPLVEQIRASWGAMLSSAMMGGRGLTPSSAGQSVSAHASMTQYSTVGRAKTTTSSTAASGPRASTAASTRHSILTNNRRKNMEELLNVELVSAEGQAAPDGHASAVTRLGQMLTKSLRLRLPGGGAGFAWSPAHGQKLGAALELIVNTATDPTKLEQELWLLAQKHLELGVTPDMLDDFLEALICLLQVTLPEERFNEVEPAWRWLWSGVQQIFVDVLARWRIMQTSLASSWELLTARSGGGAVDVAELFYSQLFERAPMFQHLFQRRNETMVHSFADALSLIVRCSTDSSVFQVELEDLAVRHCKYDLHSWSFSLFGEILIDSLICMGGEQWTDDYTEAWSALYNSISQVFVHVLDSSRSTMCSALVRGSVSGVKKALASAPRGERAGRALSTAAGKKQLSPILWALRDGMTEVAEVLIDDLLCIRADRSSYYYGAQEMWNTCPMILRALIEFAPNLIEQFLDGHMWVGRSVANGCRRVNLWVSFLYGDPHITPVVFAGPLGMLVDRLPDAHMHVFTHPVVSTAVELKWRRFGIKKVLYTLLQQIICLVAYIIVSVTSDANMVLRLAALIGWFVAAVVLLGRVCWSVLVQTRTGRLWVFTWGDRVIFKLPMCLTGFFMQLRLCCCLLSLCSIAYMTRRCWTGEVAENSDTCIRASEDLPPLLSGLVAFMQWIQVAEFFKMNSKLAAIFYLGQVMLLDAMRFMVGLAVWLVAVGAALHRFTLGSTHGSDFEAAYAMFALMLGVGDDADLTFYDSVGDYVLVRLVFLCALWASIIPILNLMVAAMVSTYTHAEEMTVSLAEKARATAVLEAEEELPAHVRDKYWHDLNFDAELQFAAFDRGPPGGVTLMLTARQITAHPSYERCVERHKFFAGEAGPAHPWPQHDVWRLGARGVDRGDAVASLKTSVADLKQVVEGRRGGIRRLGTGLPSPSLSNWLDASNAPESVRESANNGLAEGQVAARQSRGGVSDRPSARGAAPSPPATFNKVMLESIAKVSAPSHCFVAVEGWIYDVRPMMGSHPGGNEVLLQHCGTDATMDFARHHDLLAAKDALSKLPSLGKYEA